MPHNDTVAIIGAGPAGLAAARWTLANGLTPMVFERYNDIGGMWNPHSGGVWPLRTNLSKFTCSFSDLPWPESAPMFPTAQQMYNYFHDYAEMFELRQYIRFNSYVYIEEDLAGWAITIGRTRRPPERIYAKFLVVASGSFAQPNIPNIPGLEEFGRNQKTHLMHSHHYKNLFSSNLGETVTVVGMGFSGAEIAAHLAQKSQVLHVMDRPHWVLPRNLPDPIDLVLPTNRRINRKTPSEVRLRSPEENIKANSYLAKFCPEQTNTQHPLHIDPQSSNPPFVSI
ncbi:MAG TPA: NAD(P)/FAD-dependent oxidoreductase, partial [Gammaproteobacteria bacterium]|nr:NAD(P)/FAD-dependent oxidoreductase [Gammaproteobacteria bacterium]